MGSQSPALLTQPGRDVKTIVTCPLYWPVNQAIPAATLVLGLPVLR